MHPEIHPKPANPGSEIAKKKIQKLFDITVIFVYSLRIVSVYDFGPFWGRVFGLHPSEKQAKMGFGGVLKILYGGQPYDPQQP